MVGWTTVLTARDNGSFHNIDNMVCGLLSELLKMLSTADSLFSSQGAVQ